MQLKRIYVAIKGKKPGLLMNKYRIEASDSEQTIKKKKYIPEEEAAKSAYITEIDGKKQLYIPALNVYTMMVQACSGMKVDNPEGGRKIALRALLAGVMQVVPEKLLFATDKYEIDIRGARIGKARIPRARAWLPEWNLNFDIVYDSDWVTNPNVFMTVLREASKRFGLGDYRPQHMGPFGTFTIIKFEPSNIIEPEE